MLRSEPAGGPAKVILGCRVQMVEWVVGQWVVGALYAKSEPAMLRVLPLRLSEVGGCG
ncbi:hypothetical protein HLASA_1991 [Halanaeroarchaeum sulfurireducens]|uniref:Uncharacterized protein n=1 Tax=Halanaeroarchaeum sulfurireducens TaxID=1604004 RepID=A0A0N9N7P0_9EURY|nr:hypothetical protein HLASA_1991 [Halanaeroarchaeum sulfurireducens]